MYKKKNKNSTYNNVLTDTGGHREPPSNDKQTKQSLSKFPSVRGVRGGASRKASGLRLKNSPPRGVGVWSEATAFQNNLSDIAENNFTDMAVELKGLPSEVLWLCGGSIKKTVSVIDRADEKKFGKPVGKYLTLECADFYKNDELKTRLSQILSDCIFELIEFLNADVKKILVVGVGNIMMTADALGPDTVNKIRLVEQNPTKEIPNEIQDNTRLAEQNAKNEIIKNADADKQNEKNEIQKNTSNGKQTEKNEIPKNFYTDKENKKNEPPKNFRKPVVLCTVIPNVVGMTGIESFDLVCAAAEKTKPDLIIAVDALAASNTARLKNTFQLSTAGLQPGGGVKNHRPALTRENLGVPVAAVGVPLVVRAANLAADILESYGNTVYFKPFENAESSDIAPNNPDLSEQKIPHISETSLSETAKKISRISDMIVTVKDINVAVAECSDVISSAINSMQNPIQN
jgi:hypothetical protein